MSDKSKPDAADHEQRIRERAYILWEQDGRPQGADLEYWERARALVGMEENPQAGQIPNPVHAGEDRPWSAPPVEEAAIQENLGEFPDRLSDQGERKPTPAPRRRKR